MSIIKLKDIIESMQYGPHLKTAQEGPVKYLKGNHFDDDYDFSLFNDSYSKIEGKQEKYLLREGDILLAAKGYRNFAWKYQKHAGRCIASSTFFVIKVNTEMVLPDYFVLLINSPQVQHRQRFLGLGPVTPSIPKNELLNIDIFLPTLDEQENAVKIYSSIKKQIKLQRKILEEKIKLKNGLLNLLTINKVSTKEKVL